jgi:hypothetical protein
VARLDPTVHERSRLRDVLLGLLSAQDDPETARELERVVTGLAGTAQERAQVREKMLEMLAAQDDPRMSRELAQAVAGLARTAEERASVREALLGLLPAQDDPRIDRELTIAIIGLGPVVRDLSNWPNWPVPPTAEFLAAARQNSPLADWLAVLPSLSSVVARRLSPSSLSDFHAVVRSQLSANSEVRLPQQTARAP